MVTFILVEETDEVAVYWYYPEGKMNEPHGVVTLFKKTGAFEITEFAPDDVILKWYARHMITAVRESYNKGVILKKGGAAWY